MKKFEDKIVIVTGGTRGIGKGVSKAFLTEGAIVIATYASNDEAALGFKNELDDLSEKLFLRKFDISNSDDVETFYHWIEEKFGEVHVLVNNGGIRKDGILASMTESMWDDVLNINLKGSFLMAQKAVLFMMKKRFGRIINISSIGGVLGLPGQANYAASKAGQIALSKSLSKEVGKRGITINNVLPGFIETELISDLEKAQVDAYKNQIPLKRFGKIEDIAHTVLFLADEKSNYITGASIEVTGGL